MELWNYYDGEPFLKNPPLFISGNPSKRRRRAARRSKKMAKRRMPPRNAKGRFVKRSAAKRRKTAFRAKIKYHGRTRRVRVAKHPVLVNRKRKRYHRRNPGQRYATVINRRRHRRNPNILAKVGLNMPTIKAVGYTVLGVVGTPFVEGFAVRYLPAAITGNAFGNYAVKLGSAWLLSFGVDKVAGREAAKATFVGGAAYIAVVAIRQYFPTLLGTTTPATAGYMGKQPLLGSVPRMGAYNLPITAASANRLDPANRF